MINPYTLPFRSIWEVERHSFWKFILLQNNTPSFGFHWQCRSVLGSLTPNNLKIFGWLAHQISMWSSRRYVMNYAKAQPELVARNELLLVHIGSRDIFSRALAMRMLSWNQAVVNICESEIHPDPTFHVWPNLAIQESLRSKRCHFSEWSVVFTKFSPIILLGQRHSPSLAYPLV